MLIKYCVRLGGRSISKESGEGETDSLGRVFHSGLLIKREAGKSRDNAKAPGRFTGGKFWIKQCLLLAILRLVLFVGFRIKTQLKEMQK